jgi:hypothetical protein
VLLEAGLIPLFLFAEAHRGRVVAFKIIGFFKIAGHPGAGIRRGRRGDRRSVKNWLNNRHLPADIRRSNENCSGQQNRRDRKLALQYGPSSKSPPSSRKWWRRCQLLTNRDANLEKTPSIKDNA